MQLFRLIVALCVVIIAAFGLPAQRAKRAINPFLDSVGKRAVNPFLDSIGKRSDYRMPKRYYFDSLAGQSLGKRALPIDEFW